MPGDAAPIAIEAGGRRVLLKWHKLRQRPHDPPFALANLRAGLAAGASLEIDARVLADGDWVCLHDDVLDEETTGTGPVGAADSACIAQLHLAGADYPPPMLREVASTAAASPASSACLQIDLKEPRAGLSEKAIRRFAGIVGPIAPRCLLSGTEWAAVQMLGEAIPGLRLGFDPLDLAERRTLDTAQRIEAFVEEVAATAPAARCFYLYHRFVSHAVDRGVNPIPPLKARGAIVDVWTLDATTPEIERILPAVLSAGADQITTNDPVGIARLWEQRSAAVSSGFA